MTRKHKINLPARCVISVNVSPMSLIGEVSVMLAEQLNITRTKESLEFTLYRLPSTPLDGEFTRKRLSIKNLMSTARAAQRFLLIF